MTHNHGTADPVLDAANAAFIQQRVSINIAANARDNRPALSRAYGCRVSVDRRQVTVYVYRQSARDVLNNVRGTGAVAVVFSRPSTHETLQLKADDAELVECNADDEAAIAQCSASFAEELMAIGFARQFAAAMIERQDGGMVGVRFTPNAAFIATPGPRAGEKLPA
jgi:hypothetical protein